MKYQNEKKEHRKKKVRVSKEQATEQRLHSMRVFMCLFVSKYIYLILAKSFSLPFICAASVRFQGDILFNSIFKEKRCKINFKEKQTQTVR